MFENLRAALAAKLVLVNEGQLQSSLPWSADVFFSGAHVGTLKGYPLGRSLTLMMRAEVQQQIMSALYQQGFQLDLSKTPRFSIQPDTPFNFIRLALVQIADELELLAELKLLTKEQTLVLLSDDPARVAVFDQPFTSELKDRILRDYPGHVVEFINESIMGL